MCRFLEDLIPFLDFQVDRHLVAFSGRAWFGRIDPGALGLLQTLQHLIDRRLIYRGILRFDPGVDVGARVDIRVDRHGDPEGDRLGIDHLDLGITDRNDLLLLEGSPVEILHDLLVRLFEEDAAPIEALDHRAGGLALSEPGECDFTRHLAVRAIHRPGELVLVGGDVEYDLALGPPLYAEFHARLVPSRARRGQRGIRGARRVRGVAPGAWPRSHD